MGEEASPMIILRRGGYQGENCEFAPWKRRRYAAVWVPILPGEHYQKMPLWSHFLIYPIALVNSLPFAISILTALITLCIDINDIILL